MCFFVLLASWSLEVHCCIPGFFVIDFSFHKLFFINGCGFQVLTNIFFLSFGNVTFIWNNSVKWKEWSWLCFARNNLLLKNFYRSHFHHSTDMQLHHVRMLACQKLYVSRSIFQKFFQSARLMLKWFCTTYPLKKRYYQATQILFWIALTT